jgi:HD-GYP domain-containing protein (c-di-GMP phosphodiesterase class II)
VHRITEADVRLGQPLSWDCYDGAGVLLLKKGVVVSSERQLEGLITRGLFVVNKPSQQAAPPREHVSPFHILDDFKRRLKGILDGFASRNGGELPARTLKFCADLQALCETDSDAALGYLHLDTECRYTVVHPLHVAILVELIAKKTGIAPEERQPILAAALTANVAMMELQEQLHKQEAPLNDLQKEAVRIHPVVAVDLLLAGGVQNEPWIHAVLHHHEKIDGRGYPGALRGELIPQSVRIISLADTYSAMITPRIYRDAILARDALREIFLKRGSEMDAGLAELFIKELGVFPPGAFVKLQNGETAIVTQRGEKSMAPFVYAVLGPRGAPLAHPIKRNTADPDFVIREMVIRDKTVKVDLHRLWGYQ